MKDFTNNKNRRVLKMSKEKAILFTVLAMLTTYGVANAVPSGPFGYDLQADMHRSENQQQQQQMQSQDQPQADANGEEAKPIEYVPKTALDFYSFVPIKELYVKDIDSSEYYSNPTMKSAIYRYKSGNYTGCLQELYAYIKKHPNDAYAYYYMGLSYTRIGKKDVAAKCFQKSINCKATGTLLEMAVKGRDCIKGGIYCHTPVNPKIDIKALNAEKLKGYDDLDKFIMSPYTGHGFTPELEKEYQQKQLDVLQKTINNKDNLNNTDMQQLKKIEREQSYLPSGEVMGMAANIEDTPSNQEILDAIDVLRRAGLNISANSIENNSSAKAVAEKKTPDVNPANYINPEYENISMLLGNGNNNNSDPMMSMLPYMLKDNENGKNIDPQVVQAMMMHSMMSGLNGLNSTDNK